MPNLIEIPDLGKKDKESKKSGVAWAARSRSGAFDEAAAASGRSGASAAAALRTSSLLSGRAAFLALTAGALASAALFFSGGAGLEGLGTAVPDLGALDSGLKIRAYNDNGGLTLAARSAKGVLAGARASQAPGAGAPNAAPKAETRPDGMTGIIKEAEEVDPAAEPQEERKELERFTPKNDAWTSGGSLNAGGASNGLFKVSLSKFGAAFDRGRLAVFSVKKDKPASSVVRSRRVTSADRGLNLRGHKTSRALGTLRAMQSQNAVIASVGGETQASAAHAQWTGTQQAGGGAIEQPATAASAAAPSGGGGVASAASGPIEPEPPVVPGGNVTPWQSQADEAVTTIDKIKDYFLEISGFWLLGNLVAVIDRCVKVDELGDKLNVLGRQTNELSGQGQGDLFLTLGKKTKEGAWVAATQSVAGALMMYLIIDAIKPDREEIEAALKPAD